jgi:ethanolamine utilization protein EutA
MAIDVGARLVAFDDDGVVTRIEPTASRFAERAGVDLAMGRPLDDAAAGALAREMVRVLLAEINPDAPTEDSASFLRTEPLWCAERPAWVTFSGGTAEFVYDRAAGRFGDLGPFLAEAIREHTELLPAPIAPSSGGLRATAIGASQHTVQVSGSTVCVHPTDVVPLRNTPVVRPRISWETLDEEAVAEAVRTALARLDLADARTPVAIVAAWEGSATYARIRAFGAGVVAGLGAHVAAGHPVILVFSGDVGGLVGLHLVEEAGLGVGVISIDGVELREFDYIDIGALIPDSGAVPLVIKSLVFSSTRSDLRKRS